MSLNKGEGIPFKEVIKATNRLKYGSNLSVMFKMLFLTGCRIKELERMNRNMIIENHIYWIIGKNQKGRRKEFLPKEYLVELQEYWLNNRLLGNKVFGINSGTFRRYFNRHGRKIIGGAWLNKDTDWSRNNINTKRYNLRLKGLRKNYQTLEFARQLDKWKDAYVALQFTSKKLKHSSERITAYHYIQDFDTLEMDKYKIFTPAEILCLESEQKTLLDFGYKQVGANPLKT